MNYDPSNPDHVRQVQEEKDRLVRVRNPRMLWYLTDEFLWNQAQERKK